jgi:hypothetical protein
VLNLITYSDIIFDNLSNRSISVANGESSQSKFTFNGNADSNGEVTFWHERLLDGTEITSGTDSEVSQGCIANWRMDIYLWFSTFKTLLLLGSDFGREYLCN